MDLHVEARPAEELAPGIFRISLPLPWQIAQINCYVVRHGGTCTIVDTGILSAACLDALTDGLRYLGIGLDRIEQIVVTHSHSDHIGQAGRLQELAGARLILHRVEADLLIERFVDPATPMRRLQDFLRGYGVATEHLDQLIRHAGADVPHYAPCRPDVLVHGGEAIPVGQSSLQVIWTPGHSPGHCCYFDVERKVLFSGDHVLSHITPNVGRQAGPLHLEHPLLEFERSVEKLLSLDLTLTLPGHGRPIADLRARGAQLLASHQRRRERCLAAVAAGHDTLEAIALVAFRGHRSGWAKRSAMLETLSHLDALVVEGRLESAMAGGVTRFRLALGAGLGARSGNTASQLEHRPERALDEERADEHQRETDESKDAVEFDGHE